MSAHLTCGC